MFPTLHNQRRLSTAKFVEHCRQHLLHGVRIDNDAHKMTSTDARNIGLDRRIPRRDFLNGVAIAIGCSFLDRARLLAQAADYPPALTGLRGNYPAAVEPFEALQRGAYRQFPALDTDTHEEYDLVIVGGGI